MEEYNKLETLLGGTTYLKLGIIGRFLGPYSTLIVLDHGVVWRSQYVCCMLGASHYQHKQR